MSKLLRIVGMLTMLMSLTWQVEAAELSLVCPCQAERVGQTAVKITAGIRNTGETDSGELRIFLGSSSSLSIGAYYARAYRYFPETLRSGESYQAGTEATIAFQLPTEISLDSSGRTHLVLLLQEKVDGEWATGDQVRLGPPITFPDPRVGGESSGRTLFLEGKPSLEIEGSEATLRIPKVVNSSLEAVTISRVVIGHYPSAEFWGQGGYLGLSEDNLSITVEALSSLTDVEIKGDYSGPRESEPFTHLSLRSEDGVEVWETIEAREGNVISTYPFTANSIDFLVDSDDDGVSDFNEDLFNTDPTDATSQPETVVIDVMALYTPAVATAYNNEPEVKILHELEWGNQAFRNSNINARFSLVKTQLTNYEGLDLEVALDAVRAQTGVFEGIDAVRDEVGADLLVLYVEEDPDDELCGLATISGVGSDGDLGFTKRSHSAAVIPAGCRTVALTHEFGHNMGLGHDAREEIAPVGTFDWSRGHGVDGLFSTIMAYQDGYNYVGPDIQYFSNPDISCNGQACGVDRSDLSLGADAALSIRTTMYQIAELTAEAGNLGDDDGDGITNDIDAFPNDPMETKDSDGDGVGDNADVFPNNSSETVDTDGDGVGDNADAFPQDASEWADTDGDGIGDNSDLNPNDGQVFATQFLQTTSTSQNITNLHILNSSETAQTFKGTLRDNGGNQLGSASVALGSAVPATGRLILSSADLEDLFGQSPWSGPAMLRVEGESSFELMSKLISPSGLVSNSNCVREDRVLNVEGFDSSNMTYVRLINTENQNTGAVIGTLYDTEGDVIGSADSVLAVNLGAHEQVWVNRNDLAGAVGVQWNGEALLEVNQISGLKLLNLNYITDEKTFFNFSCFEDNTSGTVYLQTTSTSQNVSLTHLVNTSDTAQQLTGTLYSKDGSQLGEANQPLHGSTIAPKGRVVISSSDIEAAFNVSPWSGPAMLEVQGSDTFALMTKLTSPSGLISNTNCVRQDQVHNVGGFDKTDMTYVRFINTGDTALADIRGSLHNAAGGVIGAENPILLESLAPKSQVFRNRDQLSSLVDDTWNGTASLVIANASEDLRLLNLNYINNETFFNFSCYETGQ